MKYNFAKDTQSEISVSHTFILNDSIYSIRLQQAHVFTWRCVYKSNACFDFVPPTCVLLPFERGKSSLFAFIHYIKLIHKKLGKILKSKRAQNLFIELPLFKNKQISKVIFFSRKASK